MKIYSEAKSCLDTHITLNDIVPAELGCAEAVSYVLAKSGANLNIPAGGFEGTSSLYSWLRDSGLFTEVETPLPGDIVISPTGTSTKNSPHGHVGIVALFGNGILSNSSSTGLFMEHYTIQSWSYYFTSLLGFPVYYFRAK